MTAVNGYGSYLIRESESTPGDFALSVRDMDVVTHYKIWHLDDGGYFIFQRTKFSTLQDLVAHYQHNTDGLCVNLKNPCAISITDVSGQNIDEWQTNRSSVRLAGKLMSSQFTETWEGMWNGTTPIAVKILKPQQIITVDNFLQAANLLKKLHHQNIVQLYAVCSMEEPVYVITELVKYGSLLEYLRGEGRSTELPQLMDMASQVAAGMAYLEEQNVLHRDLGARNILVSERLICKVGNFEMAQVDEGMMYVRPSIEIFAIKWAAPEVILHRNAMYVYSMKSDVWSFGILLYEIITYGQRPYPNMSNDDVKQQIQQGYRMPRPTGCPDQFYVIMLDCWQMDATYRPTFETLLGQLQKLFTNILTSISNHDRSASYSYSRSFVERGPF